ncbi:MAG: hypothetical protein ACSHX9_02415 [Luteolibacter sp.]
MGKSRTFIAGACIVCIAIGYLVGKGGKAAASEDDSTIQASSLSRTRSTSRESRSRSSGDDGLLGSLLAGRSASEIPASELAEIIARLSEHDPSLDALARARQSYQLQLLFAGLSADDLEEIAGLILSDPDAMKKGGVTGLISALSAIDTPRALAWASSQEDGGGLLSYVISTMAKDDPHGAADMLREALLEGNIEMNKMWSAAYGIAHSMGKLGALPLLEYADSLPNRQSVNMMYSAMRSLSDEEQIKYLDALYLRGKDSSFPLQTAFSTVATSNSALLQEWVRGLPDGEEKTDLQMTGATRFLQNGDKDEAAEWFKSAIDSSPGREKELLVNSGQNMAYNNPEGFAYFASLLPAEVELTAKDLENVARSSMSSGNAGFTAIADALPNPEEKAKLIVSALESVSRMNNPNRSMNSTDFEILSRRIDAMGLRGENAEKVNTALNEARLSELGNGE